MKSNLLVPQASAIFQARLDELTGRLELEITGIKQQFNSRNLLISTGTLMAIYKHIDAAIIYMGKTATESAILAHKAGNYSFTSNYWRHFGYLIAVIAFLVWSLVSVIPVFSAANCFFLIKATAPLVKRTDSD